MLFDVRKSSGDFDDYNLYNGVFDNILITIAFLTMLFSEYNQKTLGAILFNLGYSY